MATWHEWRDIQHSRPELEHGPRIFLLPTASETINDTPLRFPSLCTNDNYTTKITRPRSECCHETETFSARLPCVGEKDRPLSAVSYKRSFSESRHARTFEQNLITPKAKVNVYQLNQFKNLVQPLRNSSQEVSRSPEERLKKSTSMNTRLLEEHIARENEVFEKNEGKKVELMRWLQVQDWNDNKK